MLNVLKKIVHLVTVFGKGIADAEDRFVASMFKGEVKDDSNKS